MSVKKLFVMIIMSALLVATFGLTSVLAASAKEPYFGTWSVSKILFTAKTAGLSASKAKAFIGKTVVLQSNQAACGTKKLAAPTYEVSAFSASDFEISWGIPSKKLGLPASIDMVEVYSGKGMNASMWSELGTLFVKNASSLVMHVDGVFFELKKK